MKDNVTIIGLQWGDEGKGKVVDALAGDARYVARFCGGANAGHSVTVGGEKYALHLIPSGILHEGVHNVVGNGVAFDPPVAWEEIQALRARGTTVTPDNLHISCAANLVMPWHKQQDCLNEAMLGNGALGTTARGIGPCYADKACRTTALRAADLLDAAGLREKVLRIAAVKQRVFDALYPGAERIDAEAIAAEYADCGRKLAGMIVDTGAMLRRACAAGEPILFEGGQGCLLDIDHGTFPFVTSSSVTACGVPSGCGVPPKAVGTVVGVIKSYTSRVGAGPFPTEQDNPVGEIIRKRGREFGTTTGRPRRCGWLDAVAVRYAAELCGVDELALMLLMDGPGVVEKYRIATAYRLDGRTIEQFDPGLPLDRVKCVYEDFPAWRTPIGDCQSYDALPGEAKALVEGIERLVARPVGLISTGAKRTQTVFHNSRLGLE